jgi:hypothetical protein
MPVQVKTDFEQARKFCDEAASDNPPLAKSETVLAALLPRLSQAAGEARKQNTPILPACPAQQQNKLDKDKIPAMSFWVCERYWSRSAIQILISA